MNEQDEKLIEEQFKKDLENLNHLDSRAEDMYSQSLQIKGVFVGFIGVILALLYKQHHANKLLSYLEVITLFSFFLLALEMLIRAYSLKRSIKSQIENTTLSGVQLCAFGDQKYYEYGEKASNKRFKKVTQRILDAMDSEQTLKEIEDIFYPTYSRYLLMWEFTILPWIWFILLVAVPLVFILRG